MKRFLLGSVLALSCFLLSCDDNSSSGPDKKEGGGIEVPCNAENEGEVVSPADSDKEYICKNSSWNVVDSSRHCEDCKDETIAISSSSSNNNVILSASDKSSSSIITSASDESSSSVIASETKQSSSEQSTESSSSEDGDSSSSVETTEDESSSSEETEESSSSEETSMFLCDDGVTYVLDLANCEVESSSSEDAGESSSSETTTQSSSEKVEESSSSEVPVESSNNQDSSSSAEDSSSSDQVSTGICKTEAEDNCVYGELYDVRDGQKYKTIKIGQQEWMAENLNYEVAKIPKSSVFSTCFRKWVSNENPNQEMMDSCSKYGRYYGWAAAIDSVSLYNDYSMSCGEGSVCSSLNNMTVKGVCPENWHLPKVSEWRALISFVGEEKSALFLKSVEYWTDSPGIDAYGFSVLPAGFIENLSTSEFTSQARFWTATDDNKYLAKAAVFNYFLDTKDEVSIASRWKSSTDALTVRCVKD